MINQTLFSLIDQAFRYKEEGFGKSTGPLSFYRLIDLEVSGYWIKLL